MRRGGRSARPHADLAETYDATLSVLSVTNTNRDRATTVDGQVVDALVRVGESVVGETVERIRQRGVDVEDEVLQGDPYETIRDYIDSRAVDLVVMPAHGWRGLDRYLLGSVTEKVVRTVDVPVLTVRLSGDGE